MNSRMTPMDAVIFCGGRGTRLSEKTREMPKPLIELGEYPILWHIMKFYSHFGYDDFVFTLGYRGEMIIDYFLHQHKYLKSFSANLSEAEPELAAEDWNVSFVQTGLETRTAKRLLLCRDYIKTPTFMATYGDGVGDIDLTALIVRHRALRKSHDIIATITVAQPYSKYGIVEFDGDIVGSFIEKPRMKDYINIGYMVLENEVFDYISEDEDVMFEDTLHDIARDDRLGYYIHDGFWHPMDNYKDYEELNRMWKEDPKWKIWKE